MGTFKSFCCVILCLIFVYSELSFAQKKSAGKKKKATLDPDKFLEKFGYLNRPPKGTQHSERARREAIKVFQRMAHLKETGKLDKRTLAKMMAPRCGVKDVLPKGTLSVPLRVDPSQPQSYYAAGLKWKKKKLSWRALNYSPDLPAGSQRRAFYQAFKTWSDVIPLEFRETGGRDADIAIKFAYGEHGDGAANAFDGKGHTLAHAFFPEAGDTHFDEAERWTEATRDGTNLMIVAAHEFGHAIGLGHSSVQGALMAPFYQGYDPKFKLHEDDIRGAQALYGRKLLPEKPTPRPKPTHRPRPAPTHRPRPTKRPSNGKPNSCTTKFDAVFQGYDARIYVFKGKWMWRLNDRGMDHGFPTLISRYFQKPPINIGAAVYSWRTRFTYFFKGGRIFKYWGNRRVKLITVTDRSYPKNPQAAMMGRDGKISLFKGAYVWTFDEYSMTTKGRPVRIAQQFRGIPPRVEAAVRLRDGNIYFFKGANYRKYSEYYRRVERGYPKPKANPWMGITCGRRYVPK